jgi:fluoride exporter
MIWLAIAVGGALGAMARHALGSAITGRAGAWAAYPFGTYAVNALGCFLAGVVIGVAGRTPLNAELRALLGVGMLGGFTTFSAFGGEMFLLMQNGAYGLALGYAVASMLTALVAVWAGVALMS